VGLLGRREKDFNQTFEGGDGVILFFSGFFFLPSFASLLFYNSLSVCGFFSFFSAVE
jgi:hypothetical protein